MSNKLTFELVQPSEFEDYYYNVKHDGDLICHAVFNEKQKRFLLSNWYNGFDYSANLIIDVGMMCNKLNAETKADKLFGFL